MEGQIDDLLAEVRREVEHHHKVLVTTLTKRMAEDLTDYMKEAGIRVRYLHSDIDTLERTEIIRDMRLDVFDVLVGITCSGKVSIFQKSHWSQFWMQTRKASCVQKPL